MTKSLIFIGMAGVGKSTIGKSIAQHFNLNFIDTDKLISNHYHMSIQNLILKVGDKKFNEIESEFVVRGLADLAVISPGGSFVYAQNVIDKIRNNVLFIYLFDEPQNIINRISNLESRGIVGLNDKSFDELCYERHDLYQKIAHVQFNLNQYSFNEVTNQLIEYLMLIFNDRL